MNHCDDRPLSPKSAAICLNEFCSLDQADKVVALFKRQRWTAGSEVQGSHVPLQIAIQHDAIDTFKALLAIDDGDESKGLSLRFLGGQSAIHHCACAQSAQTGQEIQSPRCLAHVLTIRPLAALEPDAQGWPPLDWAASAKSSTAYHALFDSLLAAARQGLAPLETCQATAVAGAFSIVSSQAAPPEAIERLERLADLGLDWRSVRNPEGQSLLGRVMFFVSLGHSSTAADFICRALLVGGASVSSPWLHMEGKAIGKSFTASPSPAYKAFFDQDHLVGKRLPLTMRWMLDNLSDDLFIAASSSFMSTDSGAPSEFFGPAGAENALLFASRHFALRERLALQSSVSKPANCQARARSI